MAVTALECRLRALPGPPLAPLSDEGLGALAAAGDGHAFAVLYDRYHAPLRGYCRRFLHNEDDLDDVVQTTMARALAGLPARRPTASWRAWVFRIAHNEAIEVLRRRRPTAELTAAAGISGDQRLEDRERLSMLVEDLKDLPQRQRSALLLRELGGLEPEEIGEALAMSPGAARQAVFEARSALRDFAAGRDMACEHVQRAVAAGDGRRLRERRLRAHLRDCAGCSAFRDGRRRRFALLPSLPFLSGLLQRLAAVGEAPAAAKTLVAVAALSVSAGLASHVPHATPQPPAVAAVHHAPPPAPAPRPPVVARTLRAAPPAIPRPVSRAARPHRAAIVTRRTTPLAPATPRPTTTAAAPSHVASAIAPTTPAPDPAPATPPAPTPRAEEPAPTATAPAAAAPPGQERTPPGQGGTPPGQDATPPGQERTPPGQGGTPPGQDATPPGQAKGDGKPDWAGPDASPPGRSGKNHP